MHALCNNTQCHAYTAAALVQTTPGVVSTTLGAFAHICTGAGRWKGLFNHFEGLRAHCWAAESGDRGRLSHAALQMFYKALYVRLQSLAAVALWLEHMLLGSLT